MVLTKIDFTNKSERYLRSCDRRRCRSNWETKILTFSSELRKVAKDQGGIFKRLSLIIFVQSSARKNQPAAKERGRVGNYAVVEQIQLILRESRGKSTKGSEEYSSGSVEFSRVTRHRGIRSRESPRPFVGSLRKVSGSFFSFFFFWIRRRR